MNRSLTLLWGATGEQEWTPALVGHNVLSLIFNYIYHFKYFFIYFTDYWSRLEVFNNSRLPSYNYGLFSRSA
jgi:hypothetical protein